MEISRLIYIISRDCSWSIIIVIISRFKKNKNTKIKCESVIWIKFEVNINSFKIDI